MLCPNCQTANPDDAIYCGNCGRVLIAPQRGGSGGPTPIWADAPTQPNPATPGQQPAFKPAGTTTKPLVQQIWFWVPIALVVVLIASYFGVRSSYHSSVSRAIVSVMSAATTDLVNAINAGAAGGKKQLTLSDADLTTTLVHDNNLDLSPLNGDLVVHFVPNGIRVNFTFSGVAGNAVEIDLTRATKGFLINELSIEGPITFALGPDDLLPSLQDTISQANQHLTTGPTDFSITRSSMSVTLP